MSDYRELINEAIKLGRQRINEVDEEVTDEPIENMDDTSDTDVISVSKQLTDAFDNFLDLLASSISDLEDEAVGDPDGMDYIIDLTQRGQKMETAFSRLKEVLLKAPKKLGGDQLEQEPVVEVPPEPETKLKAGFGDADEGEPVDEI